MIYCNLLQVRGRRQIGRICLDDPIYRWVETFRCFLLNLTLNSSTLVLKAIQPNILPSMEVHRLIFKYSRVIGHSLTYVVASGTLYIPDCSVFRIDAVVHSTTGFENKLRPSHVDTDTIVFVYWWLDTLQTMASDARCDESLAVPFDRVTYAPHKSIRTSTWLL
jgi:hypothetical protein